MVSVPLVVKFVDGKGTLVPAREEDSQYIWEDEPYLTDPVITFLMPYAGSCSVIAVWFYFRHIDDERISIRVEALQRS